jgi:hypothetical protein
VPWNRLQAWPCLQRASRDLRGTSKTNGTSILTHVAHHHKYQALGSVVPSWCTQDRRVTRRCLVALEPQSIPPSDTRLSPSLRRLDGMPPLRLVRKMTTVTPHWPLASHITIALGVKKAAHVLSWHPQIDVHRRFILPSSTNPSVMHGTLSTVSMQQRRAYQSSNIGQSNVQPLEPLIYNNGTCTAKIRVLQRYERLICFGL